ncbi:hypothetical protein M427DRAFT_65904 [Gonapodya prolifera JEL478]|uniref:Uncharacterized protein n=1 Tax=Gonapodya prolifera (strain JEL478) TaxID=1344416 RepID=A0A139AWL9_GONPJ|nr:hypothetical protein M427DRAFT_65904 [Gonapodya prolifera JEL478]|eukprot:KXS21104.1 hypothetical protein M427DRAFT_65904 [Gonapodya prolifera JEL478]
MQPRIKKKPTASSGIGSVGGASRAVKESGADATRGSAERGDGGGDAGGDVDAMEQQVVELALSAQSFSSASPHTLASAIRASSSISSALLALAQHSARTVDPDLRTPPHFVVVSERRIAAMADMLAQVNAAIMAALVTAAGPSLLAQLATPPALPTVSPPAPSPSSNSSSPSTPPTPPSPRQTSTASTNIAFASPPPPTSIYLPPTPSIFPSTASTFTSTSTSTSATLPPPPAPPSLPAPRTRIHARSPSPEPPRSAFLPATPVISRSTSPFSTTAAAAAAAAAVGPSPAPPTPPTPASPTFSRTMDDTYDSDGAGTWRQWVGGRGAALEDEMVIGPRSGRTGRGGGIGLDVGLGSSGGFGGVGGMAGHVGNLARLSEDEFGADEGDDDDEDYTRITTTTMASAPSPTAYRSRPARPGHAQAQGQGIPRLPMRDARGVNANANVGFGTGVGVGAGGRGSVVAVVAGGVGVGVEEGKAYGAAQEQWREADRGRGEVGTKPKRASGDSLYPEIRPVSREEWEEEMDDIGKSVMRLETVNDAAQAINEHLTDKRFSLADPRKIFDVVRMGEMVECLGIPESRVMGILAALLRLKRIESVYGGAEKRFRIL